MFKRIHVQKGRGARATFKTKGVAAAVCLQIALASGSAFAVAPATTNAERNAQQAQPAPTETLAPLTLEAAIASALQGNPDLAVAQREVEAVEGQVLQSQARPNPELAYAVEDQDGPTRTQSLQINLPIELGGKRAARIAAAERGREIALEDLKQRRVEIRAAVVAAYFEALSAQERVALAQESVDLAKRASDVVAKRVVAGKVSPVEETKAKVVEAGTRVELAQARSEQRIAKGRLNSMLDPNAPVFSHVAGNVEFVANIPSVELIQQRLATSPTVRRAQLELAQRKSLAEVERSKRIPDLTVSLGVKRPNELQRDQLLFGISVPIPLFDRNQGNLLEALKREDKARDELRALVMRVGSEVMQARERLVAIRAELEALQREVLPGAKSAYDAASIGFENGKFDFLDVLDAQRTYFAAQSQYLQAWSEAHRAAAEINRVLGESALRTEQPINQEQK